MQKKINQNESLLRRDEVVAKLQSQLDEFMQEAFDLKAINVDLVNKNKMLKEKNQVLTEELRFLNIA